ncbi:MAG: hypothetical protein AB4911_15965 [Oscillochloridaceae bacterium umkhey_bin13]
MLVASEADEATRILREHPDPPMQPDTLLLSVDGAMIPLVHGQWTEVRTLVVGEVQPATPAPNGSGIHTTSLSYFSRRTDSTTFSDLATGELHRRGIEVARRVGAVVDGADWCQTFVSYHYPEAVRILDFPHAAEHLAPIAATAASMGVSLPPATLTAAGITLPPEDPNAWSQVLKLVGPDAIMPAVRATVAAQPTNTDLARHLSYLEARGDQMQYPHFQTEGWPIGSGMVKSANKLVVEDRLKGAGMHWADTNVNPLLALRNAVCNDRWDACWTVIERELRREVVVTRQQRRSARQAARLPAAPAPPPDASPVTPPPVTPPPVTPP